MNSKSRVENQREWRRHVAGLRRFQGTTAEYCRERGLSAGALAYWQRKLGSRARAGMPAKAAGKVGAENCPRTGPDPGAPAFIPVELIASARESGIAEAGASLGLPDPRWVAELIRHLGGVRP
jgi:hypothetical protein